MYRQLKEISILTVSLKAFPGNGVCGVPVTASDSIRVPAERYGIRFTGRMQSVREKLLAVRCPALGKKANKLKGYTVDISFTLKSQDCFFEARILGKDSADNLLITIPARINRRNRDDVRLFCRFPVTISVVEADEWVESSQELGDTFTIRDLSAGGLGLECDIPENTRTTSCPEGSTASEMDVEFILPGTTRLIRARAAVTWAARTGSKSEFGIRFLNMSTGSQAYIVQYIYQEQIRENRLKKGKLSVLQPADAA